MSSWGFSNADLIFTFSTCLLLSPPNAFDPMPDHLDRPLRDIQTMKIGPLLNQILAERSVTEANLQNILALCH
ncbi:MAG: hypothetical protein ABF384_18175 [Verrucomicrobiales bacterium]